MIDITIAELQHKERKADIMAKLDEILELMKLNELKKMKEEKKNCLFWVLAIIGAVVVIAGIAYAVYRYLTPDYLDDFDDDFDDDFEDEEEEVEAAPEQEVAEASEQEVAEASAEETAAEE